jgi:hypothetical protein
MLLILACSALVIRALYCHIRNWLMSGHSTLTIQRQHLLRPI